MRRLGPEEEEAILIVDMNSNALTRFFKSRTYDRNQPV